MRDTNAIKESKHGGGGVLKYSRSRLQHVLNTHAGQIRLVTTPIMTGSNPTSVHNTSSNAIERIGGIFESNGESSTYVSLFGSFSNNFQFVE